MTDSNRIDSEAALWVVKQREGALTPDDQHAFDAWISADRRHRGSFVRLSAVNEDLRRIASLAAGKEAEAAPKAEPKATPMFTRRRAIAASVAALGASAGVGWWWRSSGETYVSGVGEMRQLSLADGSSMSLNTATETHVRFTDSQREVLLARGEAHFEVAKDRARPFVVRSGNLTVTAIGTAFTVRVDGALTDVTVTEGTVELADGSARRRVTAHQRAVVAAARPVEVRPIADEEAERKLAWRSGMVAFNGEPLAEAVAEINRHNRRHIVIDDPALASRPIVGMFRANDIDTFAQTAAAAMGAVVIEEGDRYRLESKRGN